MRRSPMRYWPFLALMFLLLELRSFLKVRQQVVAIFGTSSSSLWSYASWNETLSFTTTRSADDQQQQHALIPSNNTIVTAFLPTPTRRHSLQDYFDLFKGTFSIHDHMVIITTPELVPNLTKIRQDVGPYDPHLQRTVFWTRRLNDTRFAREYPLEYWQNLPENMPTTLRAHYTTFWVWSEKMEWLAQVAQANPFDSQFFAWVDAGMIRWEEYKNKTLIQRIPPQLQPQHFLVLNVTATTKQERNAMMGAGLMGGYKQGVLRYREAYFDTAQQVYRETKNLTYIPSYTANMASEQHLMYRTCMDNIVNATHYLCLPIRAKRVRKSPLGGPLQFPIFFLLPFLDTRLYAKMEQMGIIQSTWGPNTFS